MAVATACKPYQQVPIHESGDPLVAIPLNDFAVVQPHPYQALGAPYGDRSPFWLRQRVLERLHQAQVALQQVQPGWNLQIFDAYRPIAVQQFMVEYSFQQLLAQEGLTGTDLTPSQTVALYDRVYQFWAAPSSDPKTPPPHSTGAAIDLTLVDAQGQAVPMGGEIDDIAAHSHPNFYATAAEPTAQTWHQNRLLLQQVMSQAGFRQHPNEWWHFSWGDQLWAWQSGVEAAIYGGAV